MTITIAPNTDKYPQTHVCPIVETKKDWADDWEYRPELLCTRATICATGQDLSSCELQRAYGEIKQQWELDFSTVAPLDLMDHWIRMSLICEEGNYVVFIGQVSDEPRTIHGADIAPSGIQNWVAYGPLQTLRKIHVSESYWSGQPYMTGATEEKVIGWVPPMNTRSESSGVVIGNRSDSLGDSGSYCYGGEEVWTHRQYIDYLLAHHLGSEWRLAGQVNFLDEMKTVIKWSDTQSVAKMLRELIPVRFGVDFIVRAYSETTVVEETDNEFAEETTEGFEIFVYSLVTDSKTSGGVTIPKNTSEVKIQAADQTNVLRCNIVKTGDHRYDRVRVFGERVVICCSLDATTGTLVPGWTDEAEEEYKAATEEQRKTDKYRPVFQSFHVSEDWDFNGGSASPSFNEDGELDESTPCETQLKYRETLSWLPMFSGFDYTVNPEEDNNPEWVKPDLIPPMVFLFDQLEELSEDEGEEPEGQWIMAEIADVDVSVSNEHLGVFLNSEVNHWLAKNHWDPEEDEIAKTELSPAYDWEFIKATVAFRSDNRLMKSYTKPGIEEDESESLSTVDIFINGAECWYLAPGTYIGIDDDGNLIESGEGRVLRRETYMLDAALAGAIARYCEDRARAEIQFSGLLPWADLLGQVLSVVEEGQSDSHKIGSVITSVEWNTGVDGTASTTVRAGFAS